MTENMWRKKTVRGSGEEVWRLRTPANTYRPGDTAEVVTRAGKRQTVFLLARESTRAGEDTWIPQSESRDWCGWCALGHTGGGKPAADERVVRFAPDGNVILACRDCADRLPDTRPDVPVTKPKPAKSPWMTTPPQYGGGMWVDVEDTYDGTVTGEMPELTAAREAALDALNAAAGGGTSSARSAYISARAERIARQSVLDAREGTNVAERLRSEPDDFEEPGVRELRAGQLWRLGGQHLAPESVHAGDVTVARDGEQVVVGATIAARRGVPDQIGGVPVRAVDVEPAPDGRMTKARNGVPVGHVWTVRVMRALDKVEADLALTAAMRRAIHKVLTESAGVLDGLDELPDAMFNSAFEGLIADAIRGASDRVAKTLRVYVNRGGYWTCPACGEVDLRGASCWECGFTR